MIINILDIIIIIKSSYGSLRELIIPVRKTLKKFWTQSDRIRHSGQRPSRESNLAIQRTVRSVPPH